jgi:hypothetical protein
MSVKEKLLTRIKLFFVVSFFFIFLTNSDLFGEKQRALSLAGHLGVRDEPSLTAKINYYLEQGEPIQIVRKSTIAARINDFDDYWYLVFNSSGIGGWVFGYDLHILEEIYEFEVDRRILIASAKGQLPSVLPPAYRAKLHEIDKTNPKVSSFYATDCLGNRYNAALVSLAWRGPKERT